MKNPFDKKPSELNSELNSRSDEFSCSEAQLLQTADNLLAKGESKAAAYMYLTAANTARDKLKRKGELLPLEITEGLKSAWLVALELSDRTLAESILNELELELPHPEVERLLDALSDLIKSDLSKVNINPDDAQVFYEMMQNNKESLKQSLFEGKNSEQSSSDTSSEPTGQPLIFTEEDLAEYEADFADVDLEVESPLAKAEYVGAFQLPPNGDLRIEDLMDAIDSALDKVGAKSLRSDKASKGLSAKGSKDQESKILTAQDGTVKLNYANLYGYGSAVDQMMHYGFRSASDTKEWGEYIDKLEEEYGFKGPILLKSFWFTGADLTDIDLFAKATINEIAMPVVEVSVMSAPDGSGDNIAVQAPTKYSLFGGPPSPKFLPLPCILYLKDLDRIEQILDSDKYEKASDDYDDYYRGNYNPKKSMLAYLKSIVQTGQVFVVATSQETGPKTEAFKKIVGPQSNVTVDVPNVDEIVNLFNRLAVEVKAIRGIDFEQLAILVQGVHRHQIISAVQYSVRASMSKALTDFSESTVSGMMIAQNVAVQLDHSSDLYKHIQEAIVDDFSKSL